MSSDPALIVVVTGSGFVGAPADEKTVVMLGASTLNTADVNVVSSTTMLLNITPDNFNSAGPIVISAQNPGVGSASTATLVVTGNPIIYSVTDSAALLAPADGSSPTLAPYEIITIFGDNFGPARCLRRRSTASRVIPQS